MKFLKVLKKIGVSVVLGIVDSVPILPNIKSNLDSNKGFTKAGSVDVVRIFSACLSLILLIAYLMGKIKYEEIAKLLDLLQ